MIKRITPSRYSSPLHNTRSLWNVSITRMCLCGCLCCYVSCMAGTEASGTGNMKFMCWSNCLLASLQGKPILTVDLLTIENKVDKAYWSWGTKRITNEWDKVSTALRNTVVVLSLLTRVSWVLNFVIGVENFAYSFLWDWIWEHFW